MKAAKKSNKEYDIISLSIINCWKQESDIRLIFESLRINESVFKQGTTGSVSIVDEIGLIETLPFVGDEWLKVSYRTDWMGQENEVFSHKYRINRVDNGKQYTGKTRSYIIHFMSPEIEVNQGTIISKSYTHKTSDNIVNDIWSSFSSEIVCEECDSAPRYVVPSLTPFKAISWLSKNSTSVFGYSDYVLYENKDGWNWCTLRSMLEEENIQTVEYNIANTSTLDRSTKDTAETIEYNRLYDTMEMNRSGLYGIKEAQYSLINKQRVSEMSHQGDPLYIDQPRIHGKLVEEWPVPDGIGHYSIKANDPETVYNGSHKDLMVRTQLMSEWYGNTITLTLPGNSSHTCGKLIDLNLPSMKLGDKKEYDVYKSGEYLITDIIHTFNSDEYTVEMTVRSNIVRDI